MGYIIAAFSALSLVLGGTTFYYKHQYNDAQQYAIIAQEEGKRQEEYIKLLKHQSNRQTEILHEQYKVEVDRLHADLNSMRKQANRSSLSNIPKSSTNPNEITFDRGKLDKTIQEYRLEVSKLIGEVSDCQIDLDTLNQWVEEQRTIFGTR